MDKNFWSWHSLKENIHFEKDRPFFHTREVWMGSLGVNIGFEQDGRGQKFLRPIVIVRKFNNETFLGVPLTKKEKGGPYYYRIAPVGRSETSTAILSQVRLIDAKRLQYKIGEVGKIEFEEIKQRLVALFK